MEDANLSSVDSYLALACCRATVALRTCNTRSHMHRQAVLVRRLNLCCAGDQRNDLNKGFCGCVCGSELRSWKRNRYLQLADQYWRWATGAELKTLPDESIYFLLQEKLAQALHGLSPHRSHSYAYCICNY